MECSGGLEFLPFADANIPALGSTDKIINGDCFNHPEIKSDSLGTSLQTDERGTSRFMGI